LVATPALSTQRFVPRAILGFTGHTDGVTSVAFSPDGKTLASGGKDRAVRLWEVATGKETAIFKGHKG
jgi:WD40 repeat protein